MNKIIDFAHDFKRFTWWLAGVDENIISSCTQGDQRKHSNLGIFVLLSFFISSFVFTYLGSITNPGSFFNIFIGLLAGFFIASIERMSMINLRWQGSWKATLILIIPRIFITLFLGLIVGEAVCLNVFSPEIHRQLALDKGKALSEITNSTSSAFGEIERLELQNQELFQQIKDKESERDKLYKSFIGEAEGWSGTMKFGTGPVYQQKKTQYDEISSELQDLRFANQQVIDANNKRITTLKKERDENIEQSEKSLPKYAGLLMNIEALEKYSSSNLSLFFWRMMIILFFIALDSAPVLMKTFSLSSKQDSYEAKLEKQRKSITEEAAKSYKTDQEINDATEQIRKDKSVLLANSVYDQARIMEEDLVKKQLDTWYKQQLMSISKQPINFNTPPSKN
jgi:peptidoglycan hydrolase CwlO-like protein